MDSMGAIYGYPQLGSGKNRTVPEAPMNKLHWGLSMRSFRFSKVRTMPRVQIASVDTEHDGSVLVGLVGAAC